ncbi:exonuclease domain-containing protein [Paenibacillus dakarensis]|uniref:exonuclease domain-containing protein n=1 Tax=Paenibacillus dakarensis TaxID=1527293 RepID=UPI0006D59E15|nr:exonuclease domain-containing protein [Paenibacillus dakarensis]
MRDPRESGAGFWRSLLKGDVNSAITFMKGNASAQQIAFIRSQMKQYRRPELLSTPLNVLETVVFDLETTGFSYQHGDEIISIGAVCTRGMTVMEKESFHLIVNSGAAVSEQITALTGITQSMVDGAVSLTDGLHDFMAFVEGKVLVAYAAGHDRGFLNAALWKTSRVRLTHRLLDTLMLARHLYPELSDYSLDKLLQSQGIPVDGRHDALSDALMTARLWTVYLEEIQRRRYAETLGDLYVYLSRGSSY